MSQNKIDPETILVDDDHGRSSKKRKQLCRDKFSKASLAQGFDMIPTSKMMLPGSTEVSRTTVGRKGHNRPLVARDRLPGRYAASINELVVEVFISQPL
jgi:hypothetical protein